MKNNVKEITKMDIINLYKEGRSIRSIARKTGKDRSTISKILKQNNIQIKRPTAKIIIPDYVKIQIIRDYIEYEKDVLYLEQKYGYSHATLTRKLHDWKIIRSKSEQMRIGANKRDHKKREKMIGRMYFEYLPELPLAYNAAIMNISIKKMHYWVEKMGFYFP